MVDERQTVRDILDNLFEKTHCDSTIEWCLYEENPELQIGKHASRQGRYPSFIKNPSLKFPNMTKVELQADNKRSLFILFSYLSKHFNSRNCSQYYSYYSYLLLKQDIQLAKTLPQVGSLLALHPIQLTSKVAEEAKEILWKTALILTNNHSRS